MIDVEINKLQNDPTYRKIKGKLREIEGRGVTTPFVNIFSLEDPEKALNLRRNSQELKDMLVQYKVSYDDYKERLQGLIVRRNELRDLIFPKNTCEKDI